jgi:DNA-directed RNA polymerase specialized sigma24 family protein
MSRKTYTRRPLEDAVARRQAVEEGPHDRANQPAFGSQEWFDAVYPPLLGYLRSFVARWADDAASVALLRFHEKGPHGAPLVEQIRWLRARGRWWILSQLRRGDASELTHDPVVSDEGEDGLRIVVHDGLARFLRRLRRRLPKGLDEVIRQRFDSAMTLRQIADQLDGELTPDARLSRVRQQLKEALALLRRGLQLAGVDAIPWERDGLLGLLQGLPEDQLQVLELFYGTDWSYEEIGERVCPEVVPAGRGSRARRLHRVALVHLLRRFCGSLGGLESRPGRRGPWRTISRGCGDTKSGESISILEEGGTPPVGGGDSSGVRRHVRIDAADPAVPGAPRLEGP